ncbi:hypothetical protein DD238_004715 [Peronospora effusa]|uniref:Uncharacterized protein n=1 Tax=Peronospora effusa TaxID=542832 RepID=A0A3M6V6N4_9STRA|nr:hypothetical protein DD238_004715 [Peronospora effusa]
MTNETKPKHVHWGPVSVLVFNVGYNASAVPSSGGPPVGLIGKPISHSSSMLPVETDEEEVKESKDESIIDSCTRRTCNELWLDPMERARLLVKNQAFAMDDIALICRDVRATLDSRVVSRWDQVTKKVMNDSCSSRDVTLHRCGHVYTTPREKVLLY